MSNSNPTVRAWLTVPLALCAALLLILLCALPARAAADGTLSEGHTDIFYVVSDGSSLNMLLKEDVTGSNVLHHPEDITLGVNEEAWNTDVAEVPGIGEPGYFLPQTQQAGLLWPGWSTEQVAEAGLGAVDLVFDEVTGPGNVYLFSQAGIGELGPLLADGSLTLSSGSVLPVPRPAHTHANWVFSQPGTYTMTVHADAGSLASSAHTYTWVVGGQPGTDAVASDLGIDDVIDAAAIPAAERDDDAPGEDAAAGSGGAASADSNGARGGTRRPGNSGAATNSGAGGAKSHAAGANAPGPKKKEDGTCEGLIPQIKDDSVHPAVMRKPQEVTFALGPAAKKDLPRALGPIQPGAVHMIGATQEPGVPWVGANTMDTELKNHTEGAVTWTLDAFDGPGEMFVYEQGNLGKVVGKEWFRGQGTKPEGQVEIPRNTHVHPNWVFSEPGTYRMRITQHATPTGGGEPVSAATDLTFKVGSSDGSDDGHFDIGATWGPTDCAAAGPLAGVDKPVDVRASRTGEAAPAELGGAHVTAPAALIALGGVSILGLGLWAYNRVGRQ